MLQHDRGDDLDTQAWQGAARLHVEQLTNSHSSVSLRTDVMPITCKPMTSKTVSTLRRDPGTITPIRQLRDVATAGQFLQSLTGMFVNMRQSSLSPKPAVLSATDKESSNFEACSIQIVQKTENNVDNVH